MNKIIELKNISKEYDGETVLDNVSLDIYDKQFITLLGPSGCGKTTTLRMIGGFTQPDSGELFFEGKKMNEVMEKLTLDPDNKVLLKQYGSLENQYANKQGYDYEYLIHMMISKFGFSKESVSK